MEERCINKDYYYDYYYFVSLPGSPSYESTGHSLISLCPPCPHSCFFWVRPLVACVHVHASEQQLAYLTLLLTWPYLNVMIPSLLSQINNHNPVFNPHDPIVVYAGMSSPVWSEPVATVKNCGYKWILLLTQFLPRGSIKYF